NPIPQRRRSECTTGRHGVGPYGRPIDWRLGGLIGPGVDAGTGIRVTRVDRPSFLGSSTPYGGAAGAATRALGCGSNLTFAEGVLRARRIGRARGGTHASARILRTW